MLASSVSPRASLDARERCHEHAQTTDLDPKAGAMGLVGWRVRNARAIRAFRSTSPGHARQACAPARQHGPACQRLPVRAGAQPVTQASTRGARGEKRFNSSGKATSHGMDAVQRAMGAVRASATSASSAGTFACSAAS